MISLSEYFHLKMASIYGAETPYTADYFNKNFVAKPDHKLLLQQWEQNYQKWQDQGCPEILPKKWPKKEQPKTYKYLNRVANV